MNYQDFIEQLKSSVGILCADGESVSVTRMLKNNSHEVYGIAVNIPGHNIVPTIHIEPLYDKYKNGAALEDLAKEVLDLSESNRDNLHINVERIMQYDTVKNRILFRLINTEKNEQLLMDMPHRNFLDLSVVYYISIENEENLILSTAIHNRHLSLWDIKEEDLYAHALANYKQMMGINIQNIWTILSKMGMEEAEDDTMYVATNEKGINGAAAMLFDDFLYDFYREHGAFYILPSSTDEIIMVTKDKVSDEECLKDMVYEVNRTEVDEEHVLSDSVYFYDGNERSLCIL